MATSKRCDTRSEQVEKELDRAIDSIDPMRTASLEKLQQVRSVKTRRQERERVRLADKLGKEHPRVIALDAKIDTNHQLARSLNKEAVRAGTASPHVEDSDWLVHGRVLDPGLEGIPGLKVGLYDRSGCPVEACGSDTTDKTGYFNLTIKGVGEDVVVVTAARDTSEEEKAAARATTEKDKAAAAGGDSKRETDEAAEKQRDDCDKDTGKSSNRVSLYVLDNDGVILHRDTRQLKVTAGQAEYLEVVLDEELVSTPHKTRYLGNSSSRELHDLDNEQPGCQTAKIRSDNKQYFDSVEEALALGYDFCAHCFGKDKFRR